ncbi:hypothetical protein TRICI_005144 [Trichomonascus ciferrii]|uniref:Uncharacterized protein n=1 Tax=Trichomonascus ciferrii TaxID=44093 RepID=A0A642UVV6_9ASCO|nr:hypothetical protein TRICI_005144 [Trichomonascus ciferrii]
MLWPWSRDSKPKPVRDEKPVDESVDPSLQEFYDSAKPLTPVSLAPKEVKEEYERSIETSKQKQEDIPTFKEKGLQQIDSHDEPQIDPTTGKTMLPLGQAARNNCVEYEALMANCSLKGTYWEKLNLCHVYRKQLMKCVELQTDALTDLGYNRALTRKEQIDVQNQVDDIYSSTVPDGPITDEIADKFKASVEQERIKNSKMIYRV